jgi:hypothetical protein
MYTYMYYTCIIHTLLYIYYTYIYVYLCTVLIIIKTNPFITSTLTISNILFITHWFLKTFFFFFFSFCVILCKNHALYTTPIFLLCLPFYNPCDNNLELISVIRDVTIAVITIPSKDRTNNTIKTFFLLFI